MNDWSFLLSVQGSMAQVENWVLCRIFLKKRGMKNDEEIIQSSNENSEGPKLRNSRPVFYDFLTRGRDETHIASSNSSGSSGITDVSNNESEEHEESSSCNSFSPFRRKP